MAVFMAENFQFIMIMEAVVGFAQHRQPMLILGAEIYPIFPAAPGDLRQLRFLQQALLHQLLQVDQIGVAGIGGIGLIGRIAVAGGGKGQYLPVTLTGSLQEINKTERLFTHGAYAVGTGQGGNMHQNSAFTHTVLLLWGVGFFKVASAVGCQKKHPYIVKDIMNLGFCQAKPRATEIFVSSCKICFSQPSILGSSLTFKEDYNTGNAFPGAIRPSADHPPAAE